MKQFVFNDSHFPCQDRKILSTVLREIRRIQPNRIDHLGDLIDFAALSAKYVHMPRDDRELRIGYELALASAFLGQLREAAPKARIVLHAGNHEHRLERWLAQRAAPLVGLKALTVPAMLMLEDFSVEWRKYGTVERVGGLYFTHGDVVRKGAGASAKALYEKLGVPVMCGHTHRGGVYQRATVRGIVRSYENFCTCRLDAEYTGTIADWGHGWSVVEHGARTWVEQVPVIGGRYYSGGKEWATWNSTDLQKPDETSTCTRSLADISKEPGRAVRSAGVRRKGCKMDSTSR